jgi:Ca2+:H+ antiporter
MSLWTWVISLLSIALVGPGIALPVSLPLAGAAALALMGSVLASVHHAEVVAHRVGEFLAFVP